MRIAYLAPYQGEQLVAQRGIKSNLSLAGTQKIRMVASLLAEAGHDVTIFSAGSVTERGGGYYAPFDEALDISDNVLAKYAASVDIAILGQPISGHYLWRLLKRAHESRPFDLILIYNISVPEMVASFFAHSSFRVPMILEYEDDVAVMQDGTRNWRNGVWTYLLERLRDRVGGVVAATPELQSQFSGIPNVLLRGVLDADYVRFFERAKQPPDGPFEVLYTGSIVPAKGIEALCEAWKMLGQRDNRLNIVGRGPQLEDLQHRYGAKEGIYFHGFIDRDQLFNLLGRATVCVNPNRVNAGVSGNIFPFKMVEYLGSGTPVVSTPLGSLEPEIAEGVLTVNDDSAKSLAEGIESVMANHSTWTTKAAKAQKFILSQYEPKAVTNLLQGLISDVTESRRRAA